MAEKVWSPAAKGLITRIRNTIWYRGQPLGFLKTKWRNLTFSSKRYKALAYAKLRKGEIVRARVNPQRPFYGGAPDIAARFGSKEKYYKLALQDRDIEYINSLIKKHKIDVWIAGLDQIVVYDPKAVTILSIIPYGQKQQTVKKKAKPKKRRTARETSLSGIRKMLG